MHNSRETIVTKVKGSDNDMIAYKAVTYYTYSITEKITVRISKNETASEFVMQI